MWHNDQSICSYTKYVLLGLFFAVSTTAIATSVGIMIADMFIWVLAMIVTGSILEPRSFAIVGLLLMFFLMRFAIDMFSPANMLRNSYIGHAYAAFKEKTCIKVDFK